jgi:septum formation protein
VNGNAGPARLPLLLASGSPRRLDLLAQIGIVPDLVEAAGTDETPRRDEPPRTHALRLAVEKAAAAAARHTGHLVLAADTVVAAGRRILGKAEAREDAERTLRLLSGRRHRVWTGVALVAPGQQPRTRLVGSIVTFQRLTDQQIAAYLDSGEWQGKAGGYAIQGQAAGFVRFLSGSHSGVIGLPLFETAQLLRGIGWLRP